MRYNHPLQGRVDELENKNKLLREALKALLDNCDNGNIPNDEWESMKARAFSAYTQGAG